MTINTGQFTIKFGQKIRGNINTASNMELMTYAKAVQLLKTGTVNVVDSFSCLPSANNRTAQLYFVKNEERLYFASNNVWSTIEQTNNGYLWTWGPNSNGQLGDGTITNRCSPGTIAGAGTTWCSIEVGSKSGIAVKTDGTLWTWGQNNGGILGDGTTTNRCSPGTTAGGGTTWCFVGRNLYHKTAIKTDGTLWTWGFNSYGQLGDYSTTDRCSPGTTVGGGTNWCSAATGLDSSVAIKTDGTLWTWGRNNSGQLGDDTTTDRSSPGTTVGGGTTWCQASTGYCTTSATKTDGTLWTWGKNQYGQLGDGTTTSRSSPGTTAGGGTTWCNAISKDGYFTMALKTDGTLWTWGYNSSSSNLGDGTTTDRSSPGTTAGAGTTWCQISARSAVKTDGTLWTWGCNNCGQLGDGTTTNRCSPVTTAGGGTAWCQVSSSFYGTAAIKTT
jgi:alpha-tubulin suppressor-like RCC1 family protein